MELDFTIRFKVPIRDRWVPIDEFSDHWLLLKHYFACDSTEVYAGGPWFQVNGRDWHNGPFSDTFFNAACWFSEGVGKLIEGDARVFVWAWEETNLYLERRGDLLVLEDAGHDSAPNGEVFPRLELPFSQFVHAMYEQGKKFHQLWSSMIQSIEELQKEHSPEIPPQIREAFHEQWSDDPIIDPPVKWPRIRIAHRWLLTWKLFRSIQRWLTRLVYGEDYCYALDYCEQLPDVPAWRRRTNWEELMDPNELNGHRETLQELEQSLEKIGQWLEEQRHVRQIR